ncbi:MAB_1171c family putative transporter [Actinophytocola sp.]|uniref:MAB_1171c family putative transporter n=1 Tax=Actinophytocola sp. TaxID=1872138 RepID=UPI002D7F650E|nr:MAB_1171c family putative transporter [Actinophytocola sp.]HET9143456.1 MAB_1171c family putative transporter [Actinophytocola sp.]
MNQLQLTQGLVTFLALGLMLYLLVRAPRNAALRAVTILVACWAGSFALDAVAVHGIPAIGLEPIMTRLTEHVLQAAAGYCLIAFYLFSALDLPAARRQAMWQAVPLGAAVLIMTGATALMPAGIRDAAAVLPSSKGAGPVSAPTVGLLYLTVNVYMFYAFATALLWTRRYARGAEPRLRRGLALTSVGLVGIVLALAVFIAANLVRWAGGTLPMPVVTVGIAAVLIGIVLFLVGVAYPVLGMRAAALRVWWQHRRVYRRLGPLWTVLNREFPEDALNRVPAGRFRDTFGLTGVHRRYYRRVIECRDGLVRVSPYLEPDGAAPLAQRLCAGLAAHAAGVPVPHRAQPVAVPRADGLEADARELVALSDALRGV